MEAARDPARPWSAPRTAACLALLWLLGLALRTYGSGWMLPHHLEPDASILEQIEILRSDDPELRRGVAFGKYPLLTARLGAALLPDRAVAPDPLPADAAGHRACARRSVQEPRLLVAALASLIVPATFLLARLFVGARAALLAAFLVAVSLLHIQYSAQVRPHAVAAPFMAFAVAGAVLLARGGAPWRWLVAGLGAALAVGSLQSGISVLIPLAVALVVRLWAERWRALLLAAIPIGLLALAFLWLWPFLFYETAGRDAAQVELREGKLAQSGHLLILGLFNGKGTGTILRALWSYEPWLCLLMPLGLVAALRRRGARAPGLARDLGVVLAHALPYLFVVCLYQRSFERFALPLLPHAAVLGAVGLAWAFAGAGRLPRAAALTLRAGLGMLFLALPLATAARLAWLRAQPDTELRAALWLAEQVEPGERAVVHPPLLIPALASEEALAESGSYLGDPQPFSWDAYQERVLAHTPELERRDVRWARLNVRARRELASSHPSEYVRQLDADWVVIDANAQGSFRELLRDLRGAVRKQGQLAVELRPDREPDPRKRFFFYDDPIHAPPRHFASRVWGARSFGPVIEIYRMRPGATNGR